MALSAFDDKTAPPTEDALAAVLGSAFGHWRDLRGRLATRCEPCVQVWGFSGRSTGWGLRVKRGERVVVYLTPRHGSFLASFALGERAVRAVAEQGLPPDVVELVRGARRYAEGRAVRLEIRGPDDLDTVVRLAEIKIAN